MRRRWAKIILPVGAIMLIIGAISGLTFLEIMQRYRQASNQEISAIVGVAITGGDDVEIIANLRQPNLEQISAGAEVLRQYGYFASDFASPSASWLFMRAFILILITLLVFAASAIAYFGWRDWRRNKQITRLIDYMQHLSERIYDLHLEENSEDELSILSNELYKIMVLLREAADNNQKAKQQLETALADISHQLRKTRICQRQPTPLGNPIGNG